LEQRIFPAMDITRSGIRHEEVLLDANVLRRLFAGRLSA
jgi:transcription termination factor Rho